MMASITLNLTKDELKIAVQEYVQARGFVTTDRFAVSVRVTPGDRPFDRETTDVTVTGIIAPNVTA
jgi:hypothetical protein